MAKTCTKQFDEFLLSGFLDDALLEQDRQMVLAHLMGCADCRRILSELRQIRRACLASSRRMIGHQIRFHWWLLATLGKRPGSTFGN